MLWKDVDLSLLRVPRSMGPKSKGSELASISARSVPGPGVLQAAPGPAQQGALQLPHPQAQALGSINAQSESAERSSPFAVEQLLSSRNIEYDPFAHSHVVSETHGGYSSGESVELHYIMSTRIAESFTTILNHFDDLPLQRAHTTGRHMFFRNRSFELGFSDVWVRRAETTYIKFVQDSAWLVAPACVDLFRALYKIPADDLKPSLSGYASPRGVDDATHAAQVAQHTNVSNHAAKKKKHRFSKWYEDECPTTAEALPPELWGECCAYLLRKNVVCPCTNL